MELMKGLVVDSRGDTNGIGQYVPDCFNRKMANIDWRVNNKNRPDCLIGYANRALEPGTKLYGLKGKLFWSARGQLQTLTPKMQVVCRAFYKIKDEDIID